MTARWPLWALVALLLVTFWLGVRGLNADIIWRDEYHSLEDAGADYLGPFTPVGVWRQVAERNPWHAPGYFIALNLWERVAGPDPAALRALSLLFGILAVALTYRVGKQVAGTDVGLFAAALLGTSAFYIHFLHEMRAYAMMALLSVATVSLYWHIVHSRRSPGLLVWGLFVSCAAGLFYSHYFAAMPLALLGLYHLLFVPRSRRWWVMLGAMAVAAALFLPWAAVLARALGLVAARENLQSEALTAGDALSALAFQLSNGLTPLLAVVLAALVIRRRGWRFIVLLALGSTALLLLTNAVVEVMHAGRLRYLLALWPLLALLLALGIAALQRWRPLGLALLLVWAALGVVHSLRDDLAPDLDGANYVFPFHWVAQSVDDVARSGDVVVNYVPDDGLRADLYETIAAYYFAPRSLEYVLLYTPDAATAAEQLDATLTLLDGRERVFLATMPARESTHLPDLTALLEGRFIVCPLLASRAGVSIRVYAATAAACAA